MNKPNDRIGYLESLLKQTQRFLQPVVYSTLQFEGVPNSAYMSNSCNCETDRPGCSPECLCDNHGFCFFVCNTHQINCCQSDCPSDNFYT